MPEFLLYIRAVIRVFWRSRSDRALEVLALRQQVAVSPTQTATANPEFSGPSVLDDAPLPLVTLERRPRDREARHRRRPAPCWFPVLLALALPASRWPAQDHR